MKGRDLLVKFVGDLPHDLFQEVFNGDDAHGAAVFVHHHRQVGSLALHLGQQPVDLLEFRHVGDGAHEGADGTVRAVLAQQVEIVEHPDEVVDAAVVDRQPGKAGGAEFFQGLAHGQRVRDGRHPDQRHHHFLDGAQGKLQDAMDEDALLALQVHFRAALGHHQAQVFPGDEGELRRSS